jgi:hypothetical protein
MMAASITLTSVFGQFKMWVMKSIAGKRQTAETSFEERVVLGKIYRRCFDVRLRPDLRVGICRFAC